MLGTLPKICYHVPIFIAIKSFFLRSILILSNHLHLSVFITSDFLTKTVCISIVSSMQISRPAILKRIISDKTSQNDRKKKTPTKASKKVKRCSFLPFLVICQAQSIQNHVTIKYWIKSYNSNDHPDYKTVKLP